MFLDLLHVVSEYFPIHRALVISLAGPGREIRLPHDLAHFFFLETFAVLADCLNALAFGAPLLPGLRIRSPDPAAMRFLFALIFAYNPGFVAILFAVPSTEALVDARVWVSFLL